MKTTRLCLAGALALLLSTAALAQTDGMWLHVRVEERGGSGETVHVNIPLGMVEAILPMIESEGLRHGRIALGQHHDDLAGLDLREILEALQDSPDTNFVTVRSDDESVRVAKEGGFLLVNVDEDDERVRIRLPLGVVEALLGDDDRLDLVAAVQRLGDFDGGDLVTVESEDETVRVWIDSSDTGE